MHIFSRSIGQTLKIGEDIALTVLAIDHGEARIRVDVGRIWFTLSSGIGQPLTIGDVATVTVLVIKLTEIRIGVEAGAETPVYRLEQGNRPGLHDDGASPCRV